MTIEYSFHSAIKELEILISSSNFFRDYGRIIKKIVNGIQEIELASGKSVVVIFISNLLFSFIANFRFQNVGYWAELIKNFPTKARHPKS